jgi:hypothetical protein
MGGHSKDGLPRYQCSTHWDAPGYKPCSKSKHLIVTHKIDDLVWDWICQLLTDDQALDDGLNRMIESNKDETGTRRKRMETLEKLIADQEEGIKRLVNGLAEGLYDDEFSRKVFSDKKNEYTQWRDEFIKEHDHLEAELAQVELTDDFRQEIKAMAAQVRDKLSDATFDNKRAVIDKLDLKAVFRVEDDMRWLDLTCNLSPDGLGYDLQRL